MASRSLSDLVPRAREACLKWIDACKADGIDVLIYCTFRDDKEQDELYAQGRTKPGKIVTNARAGDSWHNYRCAWDCVPLTNGKPNWSGAATYKRMAELARPFGIEWSGEWKGSLKEMAHFQFTGGLTLADLKGGKVVV